MRVKKSQARIVITFMLLVIMKLQGNCATWYVDDGVNKQVGASSWGNNNLPAQPNYEWRFASSDGLDFDTLGATGYRNYGQTALSTGLTDGVQPNLTEGILQPHQGGLGFNGSSNYLQINDATALDVTIGNFSIAVWARNSSSTDYQYIMTKGFNGSTAVGYAVLMGTNYWYCDVSDGVDAVEVYTAVSSLLSFVSVSFDAGDSLSIFVNGVFKQSTSVAAVGSITNARKLTIGYRENGGGYFYPGDLAWSGFWNGTALTTAQHLALYNAMAPLGTLASPFPTIQSAIDRGAAGDTILVQSGRYQETVVIGTAFDYIGAVTPSWGSLPELYGTDLPAAAGNPYALSVNADNEIGFLSIRGYYGASSFGIVANASSDGSLFHHLEIDSCKYSIDLYGACDNDSVINCTLDGASLGGRGVYKESGGAEAGVVQNCIIVNFAEGMNELTGTINGGYNDFYGNTANYAGMSALTGDKTVNPRFFNSGNNDYRVRNVQMRLGVAVHAQVAPFDRVFMGVWYPISTLNNGRGTWGRGRSVCGRQDR